VPADFGLKHSQQPDPSFKTSGVSLRLSLLLLTLLYVALIGVQIRRHLWFDELLTYHIAAMPSWRAMLTAAGKWDLNPPLLYIPAHISLGLAHGNPIAVRLPSILEFYFASLLLYFYCLRKLRSHFAALPVLFFWFGPMFQYATEARPYALLCFWFCALLLFWDMAISQPRHRLVLAAIAVSAGGLLSSHVFAPLSLLPFLCAEAVRFFKRRQPDWPLWAVLLCPLVVTVSYLPLFESYRSITDYPSAFQAGPRKLTSFYWHNLTGMVLCVSVAAAAAWIATRLTTAKNVRPGGLKLPLSEIALWATLLGVPVLLNAVLMSEEAAFWGRYCITTVIALCFLAGFLIGAPLRANARAPYSSVGAAAVLLSLHGFAVPLWNEHKQPVPANAAALEPVKPDLPLVTASGLTFVEMGQYESPRLLARVFYLHDRAAAIQFAHATIFEDLEDFQRAFKLPGTVKAYARFVAEHPKFLVLATPGYPEDWLLKKLAADGAKIIPLGSYLTPYKDKRLFEIQVNGST
jgi:hypothetical protein